jgi:hypothetical protein
MTGLVILDSIQDLRCAKIPELTNGGKPKVPLRNLPSSSSWTRSRMHWWVTTV